MQRDFVSLIPGLLIVGGLAALWGGDIAPLIVVLLVVWVVGKVVAGSGPRRPPGSGRGHR